MEVHVDSSKRSTEQVYMMCVVAFDFMFGEREATWGITETVDAQGATVRYRDLTIRDEE